MQVLYVSVLRGSVASGRIKTVNFLLKSRSIVIMLTTVNTSRLVIRN